MAIALELHRELDIKVRIMPVEREMRRRLFWTCYLIDRFTACGSKRPSMIPDKSIVLRLPSWSINEVTLPMEGELFQNGSNLQYHSGVGKKSQGSTGMLIDVVRILGITNRYLAAGGVKGDSHFPWHSLSNLSKIRQELDTWASGTQDVFTSIDALFGQPDSTTLVLSKLVYHIIHCLIYRPFLPIDLMELAGTGQHQSWQTEATNLCFLHANAISELVELGKQSSSIEWPEFVGYCICTAGTVHVHGAHYKGGREGEVFSASRDFLAREMQQLSELRYAWASVQHQRDTLQRIYGCHSELVKSLASNPMRYSPVFHLEDFFGRYSTLGQYFNGSHISFNDVTVDGGNDSYTGHDLYPPQITSGMSGEGLPKRKASSSSWKKRDSRSYVNGSVEDSLISPSKAISDQLQQPQQANFSIPQQPLPQPDLRHISSFANSSMPNLSQIPFSPSYDFSNISMSNQSEGFDPMFGMPQMTSSSSQLMTGFSYDHQQVMTPSGRSNGESTDSREEKDPFLSLLEQLAENEHSRGGPSELDFFLNGQGQ
jgi:Fungal specific transcription factor domain